MPAPAAREIDLLQFQVDELERAALDEPDEDDRLDREESTLADAVGHRLAAQQALVSLSEEGGALDALAAAQQAVEGRELFEPAADRLRSVVSELADVAAELRAQGEQIEEDPERLEQLRLRRQLLVDLRRKYGTAGAGERQGTLADVIAYADEAGERLSTLLSHDELAAGLERDLALAVAAERDAAASVGQARRLAAPRLALAVQAHLRELAMPRAEMAIDVGDEDPGDRVEFLLAANPGVAGAGLDQGRVRRRAGPRDAGTASGSLRGAAHPGVRRGRCRNRRSSGSDGRACPRRPGR